MAGALAATLSGADVMNDCGTVGITEVCTDDAAQRDNAIKVLPLCFGFVMFFARHDISCWRGDSVPVVQAGTILYCRG